ncbi:MAG TPA: hypothetical protein VG253_11860 [Streptosporangiaceae bacterium]|jgi:hypothetical protein|nr:hypothetical protein [Streptosporangiaceae bacterium]
MKQESTPRGEGGMQQTVEQIVTVIIGQRVRRGCDDAFENWQNRTNVAAATYPGFLGTEVTPPTQIQPEWTVIYRFNSMSRAQAWINSSTRQSLLNEGAELFDGPATQQILTKQRAAEDTLVTVVVTHPVRTQDSAAFIEFQDKVTAAEQTFAGFRGTELFEPVAGVQDDWTVLYRFDTAENLERWLASSERAALLKEGKQFRDFQLRKIDNSFGNWFDFKGDDAERPSDVRTSIAVWVGLYPTVFLLTLALAELVPSLKLWQTLLIGNLLSSFLMTYLTMPRYVNPLLRFWLRPAKRAAGPRTTLRGIGLIIALQGFWVLLFFLVTDLFWKLP